MRRLAWAAGGSVAIHLGIAALLWQPAPEKQVTPSPGITLVQARLVTYTPANMPADTLPLPSTPTRSRTPSAPVSAPTAPPPSTLPASHSPSGYLSIEDVDQPATPIGDWDIDPDLLPRNTILQVQLQLWISAQGTIDQWDLLNASLPDATLVNKVLSNLQHTPLQPALLNNIAVPSVRRLEIAISRE